jgi:uncharacterized protein YrrD
MRKLLFTTALGALAAGAAFAQTATTTTTTGATDGYITRMEKQHFRASDFIGQRLYAADYEGEAQAYADSGAEWDDIGEINDVILTTEGDVAAVLVDIGGFLGVGERHVAVNMTEVTILAGEDGDDWRAVVDRSREQLEQAPEFDEDIVDGSLRPEGDTFRADARPVVLAQAAGAGGSATDGETNSPGQSTDRRPLGDGRDVGAPLTDQPGGEGEQAGGAAGAGAGGMEGWSEVDGASVTTDDIRGASVYSATGDDIGDVSELVMGSGGQVEAAVIDVGGFLGMGAHSVAVPMSDLRVMRQADGDETRIYVDATEDQLRNMPAHEG